MLHKTKQQGFTLVEMIVSLGVFSIVITMAVGALLVMIASNGQLQAEQSVMTNLSFALDSMTREIRTGTNYYCDSAGSYSVGGPNNIFKDGNHHDYESGPPARGIALNETSDCSGGSSDDLRGISFVEGGESITGVTNSRVLYFFDNTGGTNSGKIMRRVGSNDAQPVTSSGIYIDKAEFYVTGSAPLSDTAATNREDQAMVTIFIEAHDSNDASANPKKYRVQTTITQRAFDI
ncbi:MAG: hypothetical protein RLZZ230_516 [Candidatus Parcubacteria bacterium]|jgi:prepilin-type N-terminal cleavage/methylation domain-containing protein